MQVFLPYPDFAKSVECLDPSRLGNQIYREALTLIKGGWKHHPASKMWANHKHALAKYCIAGLDELLKRGRDYPHHRLYFTEMLNQWPDTGNPICVGNMDFHRSHQSNLLRKDAVWYGKFGWDVPNNLPYLWPGA